MSSKLLADLNEAQRAAVEYDKGPSMVIAGAGSGKTRVLTYKIAYLLEKGINARSILALTFTNKAANEMKERIGHLVGHEHARNLWMGTFHSIFSKILRFESQLLGYSSNYSIYDTTDSKSVIKSVIKELNLNPETYKVNEVLSRISMAKNNLITVNAYMSNTKLIEFDKQNRKPQIADIYKLYTIRCKKADAMDFDDLLLNTNILFRDFPDILEKYQHFFEYILVDEYQDTNFAQYLIVNKLAAKHQNICVVGDDAQSIYAFRGARIENILNFKNDYPQHALFKLEQNYRSTQTIVNAANSIIAKNRFQIPKQIFSNQEQGNPIRIVETSTDQEEGYLVANEIFNISVTQQVRYSQFAILYRTNAQSRIFEETLRKRNIPYKIFGATSFYQRKEIKDLLAYFRVTINCKDDEALKRVINYPSRGIGESTIEKIESAASTNQVSIWEIISDSARYQLQLSNHINSKVQQFKNLIIGFQSKLYELNTYDLALHIANGSGMINDLKSENTFESLARLENLEELLNSIKEYVDNQQESENNIITLDKYMETVSLLTDTDTEKSEEKDVVSLMTIHSAKGLEFDYVFLVGLEEGLFPSMLSQQSNEEVEEERRLFYVALTRARKDVLISYATRRYKWGKPTNCTPSRFIFDIDPKYVDYKGSSVNQSDDFEDELKEYTNPKGKKNNYVASEPSKIDSPILSVQRKLIDIKTATRKKIEDQQNFQNHDSSLLRPGMRIQHQQFGQGTILTIEGNEPNQKATVVFDNAGEKKLLLKFARLQILD